MTLLDRYILRQFFKNLAMIALSFIAIYLLIDFFEKIDDFMEKGKSMGLVVKFFCFNIPFILEQVSPVCILLAGVVALGILSHTNELIALKSCGISLRKIVAPLIWGGLVCTLFFLALAQFVLPKTVSETNRIWNKEVKGRVPLGIYRNGRYYYRGEEGFYSFARPDPTKNDFFFFSYSSWDAQYQLASLIAARQANWKEGTWTLHQGQIQVATGPGKYKTEVFAVRDFSFPEKPKDFFIPQYRALELSLTGLFQDARHKKAPADKARAWAEFYGRLSYIFLGFPLLLLGLPLVLIIYRKWGRDLSLAIPVSCGMAFGCWGIWGVLQSLSKAGYLNPLIGASVVHLVMATTGLILLAREDS